MTKPKVINARHKSNPPGAVWVDRRSKYGNPYNLGPKMSREESLRKFEFEHLPSHPELVAQAKEELKGKDLICWCAPLHCHADIWLRIVNDDDA